MTVYLGNAVCDENGKASGGQPGNQTGKELRKQAWYLNKKGWVVLRPKSADVAKKLAYDMRMACDNMNIGYNQSKRNTLYTYASKVGFDCSLVKTPCECDCSSLVRVCQAYAGIKVNNFNTASEVKVLMKTGKFDELTEAKYAESSDYLNTGDILVTSVKGHTAIVLNDGSKAEKDVEPTPEPPTPTPAPEPIKTTTMIKVKGSVRVREGNGKSYPQIRPTAKNCLLPYLGQATAEPCWYKTMWQNTIGFISSDPKYTELIEVEG